MGCGPRGQPVPERRAETRRDPPRGCDDGHPGGTHRPVGPLLHRQRGFPDRFRPFCRPRRGGRLRRRAGPDRLSGHLRPGRGHPRRDDPDGPGHGRRCEGIYQVIYNPGRGPHPGRQTQHHPADGRRVRRDHPDRLLCQRRGRRGENRGRCVQRHRPRPVQGAGRHSLRQGDLGCERRQDGRGHLPLRRRHLRAARCRDPGRAQTGIQQIRKTGGNHLRGQREGHLQRRRTIPDHDHRQPGPPDRQGLHLQGRIREGDEREWSRR